MDPEVVAKLLGRRAREEPLGRLSAREREVLGADGRGPLEHRHRRSACSSPRRRSASTRASIFAKLGLPPSDDDNRRVLAVLAYLNA